MAQSRKRKNHKEKLNQRKQRMSTQNNQLDPNVQGIPVWNANDKIELYGYEFEQMYNFISSVQSAYMACNSVLNRNVLNGTVKMKFQRPDDQGNMVDLTAEEAKPYHEQFEKMLEDAKRMAAEAVAKANEEAPLEPPSQEGLPRIDGIVDSQGEPVTSGDKPNLTIVS